MIRELKAEDKQSVIELVRATKNFSDAEIAIAEELIDIVTTNPEQRDYYAYVAEADGKVAGFLLLGPTPATTGTCPVAILPTDAASEVGKPTASTVPSATRVGSPTR